MRRLLRVRLAIFLVLLVSTPGQATRPGEKDKEAIAGQKQSMTAEVVEIVHCLKSEDLDWVADSAVLETAKRLHIGFRHDRKTYPGQDMVIVLVFENSSKGDVFELRREVHNHKKIYRIENNGSFKLGRDGMEWPGEILGGIWTHEYMEKNIRRIMRGPKVWIDVKTAQKPMPEVACTWYGTEE